MWSLEVDRAKNKNNRILFLLLLVIVLLLGYCYYHQHHQHLYLHHHHHTGFTQCKADLEWPIITPDMFPHFPLCHLSFPLTPASISCVRDLPVEGPSLSLLTCLGLKGSDVIIPGQGLICDCWAWNRSLTRRYSSALPLWVLCSEGQLCVNYYNYQLKCLNSLGWSTVMVTLH